MKEKRPYCKLQYIGDHIAANFVMAEMVAKTEDDKITLALHAMVAQAWDLKGRKTFVPSQMAVVNAIEDLTFNVSMLSPMTEPLAFVMPEKSEIPSFYFWYGSQVDLQALVPQKIHVSFADKKTNLFAAVLISNKKTGDEYFVQEGEQVGKFIKGETGITTDCVPGRCMAFALNFLVGIRAGLIEETDMPKAIDLQGHKGKVTVWGPSKDHKEYFTPATATISVVKAHIRELKDERYKRDENGQTKLIVVRSHLRHGQGRDIKIK